jgi:hypothetical protein
VLSDSSFSNEQGLANFFIIHSLPHEVYNIYFPPGKVVKLAVLLENGYSARR